MASQDQAKLFLKMFLKQNPNAMTDLTPLDDFMRKNGWDVDRMEKVIKYLKNRNLIYCYSLTSNRLPSSIYLEESAKRFLNQ